MKVNNKLLIAFLMVCALPAYAADGKLETDANSNGAIDIEFGGTDGKTVAQARAALGVLSAAEVAEADNQTAEDVPVNTASFFNNLGPGSNTVLKALQAIDALNIPGTVYSENIPDGEISSTDLSNTLDFSSKTIFYGLTVDDIPDISSVYATPSDLADFITGVAGDPSPQLGGELAVSTHKISSTGNVTLKVGDNSGVNSLSLQDSGNVEVFKVDSDGLITTSSGLSSPGLPAGGQYISFFEDSDNGSNYVGIGSAGSNSNDLILLLPTSSPETGQVLSCATPTTVTFADGVARQSSQCSWVDAGAGGAGGYVSPPPYSNGDCVVGQFSWDSTKYYSCRTTNKWDTFSITWDNWDTEAPVASADIWLGTTNTDGTPYTSTAPVGYGSNADRVYLSSWTATGLSGTCTVSAVNGYHRVDSWESSNNVQGVVYVDDTLIATTGDLSTCSTTAWCGETLGALTAESGESLVVSNGDVVKFGIGGEFDSEQNLGASFTPGNDLYFISTDWVSGAPPASSAGASLSGSTSGLGAILKITCE